MEFQKYQHIERLGTSETHGILDGMVWVFPKIDGSNSQLFVDEDGRLMAGSRNRELTLASDNAGFFNWAANQCVFFNFFEEHPDLRLYGEWLCPHTLRTYRDDAWRNFYVFDVMREDGSYLTYEEYQPLMEKFGIEYIPPICKVENPTIERIQAQLEKNGYLIKDGMGIGEGIVIKNYSYQNKYGRQTWAKIITNEFKATHGKKEVTEIKERTQVEQAIVDKYITLALCEKEYAKIEVSEGEWTSKLIPRLLNTIYFCLISEESWNFVKEFKNPIVDFKRLSYLCNERIKLLMTNLF
jgi:hypothetical protein